MNTLLNETHDNSLRSSVDSANLPGADFTLQNLPFGVFRRRGSGEVFRVGVAIGDRIFDIEAALRGGLFAQADALTAQAVAAACSDSLNALMALGAPAWSALRLTLSRLLRSDAPPALAAKIPTALLAQSEAEYALPARIGDYTDFYASIHHATAVGKLFRPDQPLLPNYKWVPIG